MREYRNEYIFLGNIFICYFVRNMCYLLRVWHRNINVTMLCKPNLLTIHCVLLEEVSTYKKNTRSIGTAITSHR